MKFNRLGLNPNILSALDKMGYETPTKIQEEVFSASLDWWNIIWQSQTWTGKTWAFVISILQNIDLSKKWVKAIILAPTRELVTQIKDEILSISKHMKLRSLAVYWWEPIYRQIKMLDKWQDIVIWTPWRLIDLLERGKLKTDLVDTFVLDEVDRMLDMWFVEDIEFIWSKLLNVTQTMAFSATITPEIKGIVEKYIWSKYVFIKSTDEITTDKIDHSFFEINSENKFDYLKKFIKDNNSKKTIVFVETKRDTEILSRKLLDDWFASGYLNWDMRQRERFRSLKAFQDNDTNIFVVTDVAARWLNMKNIELVINYHVPQDPESYIHRIWRTWRAWAEWRAIMLVSSWERMLFKNIEKRNKLRIKQINENWDETERVDVDDRRNWRWKVYDRFRKGNSRRRPQRSYWKRFSSWQERSSDTRFSKNWRQEERSQSFSKRDYSSNNVERNNESKSYWNKSSNSYRWQENRKRYSNNSKNTQKKTYRSRY